MPRISVAEADAVLDQSIPVLDKGFVRLVDYLGGDARVVQAARVSYGAGTKSVREDRGLIDYLLRNEHTSPFEMVSLTFHCKMPIFVARQWIRHRTAKVNEISARYSVMKDEFYEPSPDVISLQSSNNKQGRGAAASPEAAQEFLSDLRQIEQASFASYQKMTESGLARELARITLPVNLYTEWYWTMDLHNLLRFLKLRLDPHAQWEIRQYASVILDLTKKVAPMTCEAFEEHWSGGVKLSRSELEALKPHLERLLPGLDGLDVRAKERLQEKLGLSS